MKLSNQTLMLGILTGLVAWVLDAIISWHFFPGKSFSEMLIPFDPGQILYVRSSVVILFFLFGLVAGKLVSQLEKNQQQLHANIRLLNGIRTIHECIVKVGSETKLIEEFLPLLNKSFQLHNSCYFHLKGGRVVPDHIISHGHIEHMPSIVEELEGSVSDLFSNKKILYVDGLNTGKSVQSFFAPVQLENRSFGVIYAQIPLKSLKTDIDRMRHFLALCNDVGHALAHLEDNHDLHENAEKLSNLYNEAPVGIFTSTVSGKLLFSNRALAKMLGADNPEMLMQSKLPVSRFYANPAQRDLFLEKLQNDGAVNDFVTDLLRLDGEQRKALFAARIRPATETDEVLIEGFVIDISQNRNAEKENRILQKQLSESQHFKSITVLAGGVAHEFNNILQAMMGSAYLAQLKTSKDEDGTWSYLQDIQHSGKRAAKLCDQMLSYAGKKAMLLKLEKPDACLQTTLKAVMTQADPRVRFERNFTAPSIEVRLDLPSFSEIINQLVANAIESLENSKGTVQLTTEVKRYQADDFKPYHMFRKLISDEYWTLKVVDDGSGIRKEDLPHIFEPFYTTKFQGRGLGLPSISGLIEKFDGSLGVRDGEVKGTEFMLWLPLAQGVVVVEEEEDVKASDESEGVFGTGKIWIVDDEPLICMTIERLLSKSGFEIGTAGNGVEVLEKIALEPLDTLACVILDVTMPKMGGLETLEKLRVFLPNLPVLIMSGYDESDSLESFKDLKVSGFIHKPFRMEKLQEKLKAIL